MLLPELQQLAGSMGIATGKLRKSDLIAAIEQARGRSAGSGASGRDGASAAAPAQQTLPDAAAASAVGGAAARSDAGRGRQPDGQSDDAGRAGEPATATQPRRSAAPATQQSAERETAVQREPAVERQPSAVRGEQGQRTREQRPHDGQGGRDSQGNRNRADSRQEGGRQDSRSQNRDGSNGSNGQGREQSSGGQNRDNQNRDNQNRDQRAGRSGQLDDDDDYSGGSRRSRRYRDRRGRNRDRVEPGNRNDAEPVISEDDVLIPVGGILDNVDDKNSWFIRVNGYFVSNDDVYVSNSYVRRFGLRRGDAVTGVIRQAREGERKEKFNPLVRLDSVNGLEPDKIKGRVEFTKLTPLYPQERLRLETEPHILTTRVIDLVMPIGKGQRALIASPPKAGKTSVLQALANAIATNNPECHLMVVLVDERPEEVTDMQRSVKGEVIASTFDRRPQEHTQIAELSIERAKRLVEMGHDVVVLLDSITRLGRAYNLAAPASGRILSGGVDSTALYPPKRFLGAARNIENGGSLTIIATALVETGSAMDSVIYEEFKGTGNAELKLDRKIADKRVFPAIDVDQSGTRKEEILLGPDELAVIIKLRRVLHALEQQQAIDLLLDRLKKTRTNIEFLMQIAKTAPGSDDR